MQLPANTGQLFEMIDFEHNWSSGGDDRATSLENSSVQRPPPVAFRAEPVPRWMPQAVNNFLFDRLVVVGDLDVDIYALAGRAGLVDEVVDSAGLI